MRRLIASCALVTAVFALASAQQTAAPASTAKPAASAPAATAAAPAATAGITVIRTVICTNVADREPMGAADSFPASIGNLTCFSEVKLDGSGVIQHKWYFGDELRGAPISLKVNGPKWRTNSRKMVPEAMRGPWKVEVVDSTSGTVLQTVNFRIQ
jgi:hypothetical protein